MPVSDHSGTFDVIVIGAGLAGCVAALSAAELGANVLLLERLDTPGGSSIMSADCYAFADTRIQRLAGLSDSLALLRQDLVAVGGGESDLDLIDAYTKEQLPTFDWLESHGANFRPEVDAGAGQSVPRVHSADTKGLLSALLKDCLVTRRVSIRYGVGVQRLERDPEQRVRKVHVQTSRGSEKLVARLGVILATGGFALDQGLVHRYAPQLDGVLRISGPASIGDGLRMASALGADTRDMIFIKATFGFPLRERSGLLNCMAVYKGAIAVNQAGARFTDESQSYKILGDACLLQPGRLAYQIFDQDILNSGEPAVRILDLMEYSKEGLFLSASSLEELARQIGVPDDALKETVERYNRDAVAGLDSAFQRRHLVHEFGALRPIKRPPFYAYPSKVAILGTYCGVAVDGQMRVRDVFGEIIPGLYAAGEVAGGFHGAAYMTGSALGKAAIFGRLAARQIALAG